MRNQQNCWTIHTQAAAAGIKGLCDQNRLCVVCTKEMTFLLRALENNQSSPNKTWRTSIKCHQRKWNTCPVEFIGSVVCARCTPARFLFSGLYLRLSVLSYVLRSIFWVFSSNNRNVWITRCVFDWNYINLTGLSFITMQSKNGVLHIPFLCVLLLLCVFNSTTLSCMS